MRRESWQIIGILLALTVSPNLASAHGLVVEYSILADRVEIRAAFDDGTIARKAKVRIQDGDKKVIAEGETDNQGVWSFTQPGAVEALGAGTVGLLGSPPGCAALLAASGLIQERMKPLPGEYRAIVDAGGGHVEGVSFRIGETDSGNDTPPATGANFALDSAAARGIKIGIGVGVIGLLGLALLVVARQQRQKKQS